MQVKLRMRSLQPSKDLSTMMPHDLKELLRAFNDHGVEDLIPNKIASARDRDLLDVKALRSLS
jgi:hypothetical protein